MSGPSVDELNALTERALGPLYNRNKDNEFKEKSPTLSARSASPKRSVQFQMYEAVERFLKSTNQKNIQTFKGAIDAQFSSPANAQFLRSMQPANKGASKSFILFFKELSNVAKEERRDRAELLGLFNSAFKPQDIMIRFFWEMAPKETKPAATRKVPRTKPSSRPRSSSHRGGSRKGRHSTRKNIPVRGFAVVQSTEKPWVKEANYRRWLAKLKRHTIKVRREGENEAPENMCVDSKLCKGDLGIPRRLMPQFTSPRDIRSFTTFAEKRYGIKSRRATRRAANLKPSQEEINRERVEDVQEDIEEKKLDPNVPLIVSRDGYVIDGHHRWAAYKSNHPTKKLPVLLVGAPARDVLSVAATWGAKHHQF